MSSSAMAIINKPILNKPNEQYRPRIAGRRQHPVLSPAKSIDAQERSSRDREKINPSRRLRK
jgi:hypothetical protein